MKDDSAWKNQLGRLSARAVEILGPDGATWPALTSERVESALCEWGLQVATVFTFSRGGLVLKVSKDGEFFVLKAPIEDPSTHIAAQEHLASTGIGPSVITADLDRGLLLLEHINRPPQECPAPSLQSAVQVIGQAHKDPLTKFPPIVPWLRSRLLEPPSDFAPETHVPPRVERMSALSVLDELEETSTVDCFIHGDLNIGNILWCESGLVRLIDARGFIGDPAYDFAYLAVKIHPADIPLTALTEFACTLGTLAGLNNPGRCGMWVSIIRSCRV